MKRRFEGLTTERERELIRQMTELVGWRGKEEQQIRERDTARSGRVKSESDEERSKATSRFENEHSRLVAVYREAREAILYKYETDGYALAQEEERHAEEANSEYSEAQDDAKAMWQHRRQEITTTCLSQEVVPQQEYTQFKQQAEAALGELQALLGEGQAVTRRRCDWPEDTGPPPASPVGLSRQEYSDRAAAAMLRVREALLRLQQAPAARFIEEGWPWLIWIFGLALAVVAAFLLWGKVDWWWLLAGGVAIPIILAIASRQIARPFARAQTLRIIPEFQLAVARTRSELSTTVVAAQLEAERKHRQLVEKRDRDLTAENVRYEQLRERLKREHETNLRHMAANFAAKRRVIEERNERQLKEVEEKYPHQIERLEKEFEQKTKELSESYRQKRAAAKEEFEREWKHLATTWSQGLAEFQAEVGNMNRFCEAIFPSWSNIDPDTWKPQAFFSATAHNGETASEDHEQIPSGSLPALRFGHLEFDLQTLEGGLPKSADLESPQAPFKLPVLLSFPACPSLLLEAEGEGRDVATQAIQNVMLRLVTSLPPGKVRFTIIDPVGLGQNFSAFMHLADYDERLVTNRIWTESNHVNQRLSDLTEHMENVIQKYLRNEFASIQEYNEHAGEVAEPFQILVVANFPANFSDEAARRLVSIAASGARCGVYTLISTDDKLKLPRNLDLADLEAQAATLLWQPGQKRFAWKHEELRKLPLALESPPDDEKFTEIIRSVGKLAKDAARVEVPFESVTPAVSDWWTADSRGEIEVPLGRAGATKLQYMRLGKGTSQHVLISGKTGSGKSTLLNALITNLALHYAPSELQFYLIDFKKGVEFKAYANFRLPHARVIAIESEREFGMSVLERLDQELKRRGDLFRKAGVQDLKNYRNANPAEEMPRILLVIDEFQEFFTTDDRISHDSSLLLDRLVRQGRAFGIHVLLGSQTLAGAYSLARSTIGQMAVRIALQCSESDAHLILSEDNTAARLLSRPGEAIYNDANGLFEGNHPFQVVWLSDHQRESYLKQLAELAEAKHAVIAPATVFEGNAAADIAENNLLRAALQEGPSPQRQHAPRAWLGSAVAIKDPTAALFRRQGGSNLLIVGQQEELALGILSSSLVSLAAQLPGASFHVLDGTRPDAPEAGFWRRLAGELPLEMQVVSPRDCPQTIAQIAAEVERRLSGGDQPEASIFLFLYNLARFRDLKKSDDFGLSGFGEEGGAGADKQLATILREGPALGVHTLIWCDSFSNVSRWIDRPSMRDLEMRVLFQMSATDSSNLMDSPAASRLGAHVAIYFSEEQGTAEKFRPYGLPSREWLALAKELLAARGAAPEKAAGAAVVK